MTDSQRQDQGFTLLEMTIALVIAGLALMVVFRGSIDGIGQAAIAASMEEGLARAQSHLAAAQAGPMIPGIREGDEGHGYHWRIAIQRVESVPANESVEDARTLPVTLFTIVATESWPSSFELQRRLSLQTYRTVMQAP